MFKQMRYRMIAIILAGLLIVFFTGIELSAERKTDREESPAVMSEAELQSQVMAFADRYVSIITAAFDEYEARATSTENHKKILGVCTYSMSSAFTIAAESNPVGGFLDMIVMITLGRIVFEENFLQHYGSQVQPLLEGFHKAERDIWHIADKILTSNQQEKLKNLILDWRESNPEILFFPSVRFNDFSAQRAESDKKEASGMLKSVENATRKVEEVRLLAERGIFLATRMPMLTGLFGGVWFSQLVKHPDMENILKDINRFSQVSERLASVAEQLPEKITSERDATIKQAMENITNLTMTTIDETSKKVSQERKATINQFMQEVSSERRQIIKDFKREEQRIKGLLSELRLTLSEGNKLVVSADSLVKGLHLEPQSAKATAETSKPFDIKEYQSTLKEASHAIIQAHDLLRTLDAMEMKEMLPQILKALETVEQKGQEWVVFAFILGIALIVVFLIGSVIAMLAYRYFVIRKFGSRSQPACT